MSETFFLDISYKGNPYQIECNIRVSRYTYQFICSTGKTQIILEKDDEGYLRALESDPNSGNFQKPEPGLVRTLMEEMERILHLEA